MVLKNQLETDGENMVALHRNKGFTLIELMVVIAIIAIVAAIAIPSLWGARKSANESSAIASLRTISTMNNMYRTRFQSYANALTDLNSQGFIDSVLGSGNKSGYTFSYSMASDAWQCNADPTSPGFSGDRHFYVDNSGVIRTDPSSSATSASSPVD